MVLALENFAVCVEGQGVGSFKKVRGSWSCLNLVVILRLKNTGRGVVCDACPGTWSRTLT